MRSILILLLLATVAFGQLGWSARGKNENRILYTWPGLDYDVYQENAGMAGYREVALGADTLFLYLEASATTNDHLEVWLEFTGDPHLANTAVKKARNIAIYWLQSLAYTARTATTGNKLPVSNMNSEGDNIGYIYRTLTPDSTSYANKRMIANISGLMGASTGRLGPFWIDATAAADSTGSGFLLITADTVGVSWRALVIPR